MLDSPGSSQPTPDPLTREEFNADAFYQYTKEFIRAISLSGDDQCPALYVTSSDELWVTLLIERCWKRATAHFQQLEQPGRVPTGMCRAGEWFLRESVRNARNKATDQIKHSLRVEIGTMFYDPNALKAWAVDMLDNKKFEFAGQRSDRRFLGPMVLRCTHMAFFKSQQIAVKRITRSYFSPIPWYVLLSVCSTIEGILEGWARGTEGMSKGGEPTFPKLDAAVMNKIFETREREWDELGDERTARIMVLFNRAMNKQVPKSAWEWEDKRLNTTDSARFANTMIGLESDEESGEEPCDESQSQYGHLFTYDPTTDSPSLLLRHSHKEYGSHVPDSQANVPGVADTIPSPSRQVPDSQASRPIRHLVSSSPSSVRDETARRPTRRQLVNSGLDRLDSPPTTARKATRAYDSIEEAGNGMQLQGKRKRPDTSPPMLDRPYNSDSTLTSLGESNETARADSPVSQPSFEIKMQQLVRGKGTTWGSMTTKLDKVIGGEGPQTLWYYKVYCKVSVQDPANNASPAMVPVDDKEATPFDKDSLTKVKVFYKAASNKPLLRTHVLRVWLDSPSAGDPGA